MTAVTLQPLFNVNDVCVDRTTYSPESRNAQELCIRGFTSDGAKAIVHRVRSPNTYVFTVDVLLLNMIDPDGYLCPNPYICKRPIVVEGGERSSKRMRFD